MVAVGLVMHFSGASAGEAAADAANGDTFTVLPEWIDPRKETGKGRLRVHATYDGVPYDGSFVNMGEKNPDIL